MIRQERSFGYAMGGVLVVMALFWFWRGHAKTASILGVVAAFLITAAWWCPRLLFLPNKIWLRLAHLLGWINSRVILTAIFLFVFTPVGMLLRALKWDPLRLRLQSRESEWAPYSEGIRDPKHYERMY
ncbi:MAG: hypothetical protein HYT88_06200 [Candidatus Omnitrophica bacterium]|nr:hypothetical protein [Candidatus Omnitrophota bacterium]MBI3010597.1 hypothetical protein [Candidatus Omnitrophota bacterium]